MLTGTHQWPNYTQLPEGHLPSEQILMSIYKQPNFPCPTTLTTPQPLQAHPRSDSPHRGEDDIVEPSYHWRIRQWFTVWRAQPTHDIMHWLICNHRWPNLSVLGPRKPTTQDTCLVLHLIPVDWNMSTWLGCHIPVSKIDQVLSRFTS